MKTVFILLGIYFFLGSCSQDDHILYQQFSRPTEEQVKNLLMIDEIYFNSLIIKNKPEASLSSKYISKIEFAFGQCPPGQFFPNDIIIPKYEKHNDGYLIEFSSIQTLPDSISSYESYTCRFTFIDSSFLDIHLNYDFVDYVDQFEFLEQAYKKNSFALLEQFFSNWENKFSPSDSAAKYESNPILKHCYEIYNVFYNPFDLSRIGGSERGSDYYAGTKWLVVQNYMNVTIAEFDSVKYYSWYQDSSLQTYAFWPDKNFPNSNTVILTQMYGRILTNYLEGYSDYTDGYNRTVFIDSLTQIQPGHWFGWYFTTHPEVECIIFTPDFNKAKLYFQLLSEGGYAIFDYTDNKWEMTYSVVNRIQ